MCIPLPECLNYSNFKDKDWLVKGILGSRRNPARLPFMLSSLCGTVAGCANSPLLINQLMCLTSHWTWPHYWPLHGTKVNLSWTSSWRSRDGRHEVPSDIMNSFIRNETAEQLPNCSRNQYQIDANEMKPAQPDATGKCINLFLLPVNICENKVALSYLHSRQWVYLETIDSVHSLICLIAQTPLT